MNKLIDIACVIFEHPDFVIINKPSDIAMHDSDNGVCTLTAKILNVEKLWLVHRLDTVTSGCLVLAKNATAAAYISSLFAQRFVDKYYIAISNKKPKKKQGCIKGDMVKARGGSYKLETSQANPAITQFISTSLIPNIRLFLIKPRTGKTHQIRVALKSIGAAILGDSRYASKENTKVDRTYLHAISISFDYHGKKISVQCFPNEGRCFNENKICIQSILSKWQTYHWPSVK